MVIQLSGLKIKWKVAEIISVCLGKVVGAGVLERRIRAGKIVKMMNTRKKKIKYQYEWHFSILISKAKGSVLTCQGDELIFSLFRWNYPPHLNLLVPHSFMSPVIPPSLRDISSSSRCWRWTNSSPQIPLALLGDLGMGTKGEPSWGGGIPPSATEMRPCSITAEWQLNGGAKSPNQTSRMWRFNLSWLPGTMSMAQPWGLCSSPAPLPDGSLSMWGVLGEHFLAFPLIF